MTIRSEWRPLLAIVALFLGAFYLPLAWLPPAAGLAGADLPAAGLPLADRLASAALESLALVRWYAREHVLLCLVPAFLIAGGISVFVSQGAVMRYLGAGANRILAYGVASVSGTVLAVCSCTVLPLFAGIYRMGAGLGPASAFLYAGPAINVLAIILTARILGVELGLARAVGAVLFSVVIGVLMSVLFRREERAKAAAQVAMPAGAPVRPLWQTALFFAALVGILVFANWGEAEKGGLWGAVAGVKWWLVGGSAALLATMLGTWRGEIREWLEASWGFAKQILPLLLIGVLVAGFLLGRPGREGLIPSQWVAGALGGNSLGANVFASVAGALMYFATLTEVPILQGLIGSGMGQGPALALLLAGPALSLPSILVLRSIMGWRRTGAFVGLVVAMATISGLIYGSLAG